MREENDKTALSFVVLKVFVFLLIKAVENESMLAPIKCYGKICYGRWEFRADVKKEFAV